MLLSRLFWTGYQAYHMFGQARYPFKPISLIERDQARRVSKIVSHAYKNVPYYRETIDRLRLRPSDFRNADDLAKLPVLERGQVQRDPKYFTSAVKPLNHYLPLCTEGGTGAPLTMYYDKASLFQLAAQRERRKKIIDNLLNKKYGQRETQIVPTTTGSCQQSIRFCQEQGIFPQRMKVQRQILTLLDPPESNIQRINEFKPDILKCFGSYLAMLFPLVKETGMPFHRPKVIISTSDHLPKPVRTLIEDNFNIPVVTHYNATEAFGIAFECEKAMGLHVNVDLYPVRILDTNGQTVKTGQSGEVVISNLVNYATILLNYKLGDIAALLPSRCSCGRSLPLISPPHGRNDDPIRLKSGKIVHPQPVRKIFIVDKVWQFQLLQKTEDTFSIKIVAGKDADKKLIRDHIFTKLRKLLGDNIAIELKFVTTIDKGASNKFRPILSMDSYNE
jgi:phenylacetate-CoA ligase